MTFADFSQIQKDCNEIKKNTDADWLITEKGNPHSKVFYRFFPINDPKKETMLFFIGGPGYSVELYKSQLTWLSEILDVNILGLDYRGLGCASSENPESFYANKENYNPRTLVQDAMAILDHLKIEKVYVYGKSFGSVPANLMGNLYGNRVHHIVSDGTVVTGVKATEEEIVHNFNLSLIQAGQVFHQASGNMLPENILLAQPALENFIRKTASYSQGLYAVKKFGEALASQEVKEFDEWFKPEPYRPFAGEHYDSLKEWNLDYFSTMEFNFLGMCSDFVSSRATERFSFYRSEAALYFNAYADSCKEAYDYRILNVKNLNFKEEVISVYGKNLRVLTLSTPQGELYYGLDEEIFIVPPKFNTYNTVKKDFPPITFVAGQFDLQTPLNYARNIYDRHVALGNETRFVTYDTLGHTAIFHGNELVSDEDLTRYHQVMKKLFLNQEMEETESFQSYDPDFTFNIIAE